MGVDLGLGRYAAVYETESRDSPVKIFGIPVRLTQRELFS